MAMWYSHTFEECGLAEYLLYLVLSYGLCAVCDLSLSLICVCL